MEEILSGIGGVANSQDDIIIWGSTKDEHNKRLSVVMKVLFEAGLRLNKAKCQIGVSEMIFLGHKITATGIYPDPAKIEAIQKMEIPTDRLGVQRLLGMVNFVGKFIPNLSEITTPLRKLIEKDTPFTIGQSEMQAIRTIQEIWTTNPVLKALDPKRQLKLSSDASKHGLGAVLLQKHEDDWLPIAYASRSLAYPN